MPNEPSDRSLSLRCSRRDLWPALLQELRVLYDSVKGVLGGRLSDLHCTYCYADPSPSPTPRLELRTIAAAAERVAESCRQKNLPFYTVFHGGGEPTLHPERVNTIPLAISFFSIGLGRCAR
jgi:hypothetical protein